MDRELYNFLRRGDQNSLRRRMELTEPNLLHQVTVEGDTVLHVAAKFVRTEIANMIIDKEPSIMYRKNSKGDTPLHIAARLGCQGIVAKILDCKCSGSIEVEANVEPVIRMVNLEKDTALHEAARSGHSKIVKLLIEKDSELVNQANEKGESPLFIAVDRRCFRTAIRICEAAPSCSYQGRNKMNALHAAIARLGDDGEMVYRSIPRGPNIFDAFAATPDELWTGFIMSCSLCWKWICWKWIYRWNWMCRNWILGPILINKLIDENRPQAAILTEPDNFGWTPLHCAAHLGYPNIVKKLLQANRSTAYSKTNEGMVAVHIAAKQGHVRVLRKLHEFCPDIWDLQDGRGRTALHIAAENGKVVAIKHILKWVSGDLINQKDIDGNTPLHLATIRAHHSTLKLLANDKRVDKTTVNKNGLSAADIIQSSKDGISKELLISLMYFLNNGGLRSLEQVIHANNTEDQTKAGANYEPKYVQETEESKLSDQGNITDKRFADTGIEPKEGNLSYKWLGQVANTNLLVATLIATVSFAAAFTVPGGFETEGQDPGMASLIKKTSYKAFVLANALAFFWSMGSINLHYNASVLVDHNALELTSLLGKTIRLTAQSRTALFVAFITGSYAALDGCRGLAAAILVIGLFPRMPFTRRLTKLVSKCTGLML